MGNRLTRWIKRHVLGKPAAKEKKAPVVVTPEVKEPTALELMQERYGDMDRRHVWAFCAGNTSQDFRGNPKYLFVYINRYRPDIKAYWFCETEETLEQVRALGFEAYDYNLPETRYVLRHTGVLVTEQVKAFIPEGMEDIVYLNLWHGVGFKRIERRLFTGDIAMGIAKKYVDRGSFYRDHQLLTVTSPMIEKEFALDCGVDEDKFVRSGYLRNLYQQNFEPVVTFDHDLRARKGLDASARLAVYAPTYRASLGDTFANAITDIEALYQCCEKNNILLIFKVHPYMQNEPAFLHAGEVYGDRPYFWFWNNQDDFYEVMSQIDLAIIDYSSIVSDMVAVGIPHYIRYVYDFQEYIDDGLTQGSQEYFDRTLGTLCYSFDDLLQAIGSYQDHDESADIARMNELFWDYSDGKADFEKVVEQTLNFDVKEREFPTLYSFDVFDTLFSRKVLEPEGVFYYVREKMQQKGGVPPALVHYYPSIRHTAEFNVREYYRKTQEIRGSDHIEIQFDEIFVRLADVYNLSEEQIACLKQWELECELDNVIPLTAQIDKVKELKAAGNTVVLISDMYLPKSFVQQMLEKADPFLLTLPLFLSSEYGVQKTTQKLFFEVYKTFEPYYDFGKWIHTGDSENADQRAPRKFGIYTRQVDKPEFGDLQEQMTEKLSSYDSFLVSALQSRMLAENHQEKDRFVINYVSLCMVPYVDWAIRDAMKHGYQTLYFISRDGHPLKRIADAIIAERKLPLKTKYIYASRRAWRIPSFIHEVDPGFYQGHGNFTSVESKDKLLRAMDLNEEIFHDFFPTIDLDEVDYKDKKQVQNLVEIFKISQEYNAYLLKKGAEERVLAGGYLRQEIPLDEKFAVVEYWGRGYTQDCMLRLWQDIAGEEAEVPFYYCRSILPTEGKSIRYNFVTNNSSLFFMESIFANMPYKSVESYRRVNGRIEPVIIPVDYDKDLYDSMQRLLPEFAARYAALDLHTPWDTDHMLMEFALSFYGENLTNPDFIEQVAPLVDSVAMFGNKRQFAPPYTHEDLDLFQEKVLGRGSMKITSSISMSITRSDKDVQDRYMDMYQILPGDNVAGNRLLSEADQEKHREFRDQYRQTRKLAQAFAKEYKEACKRSKVRRNEVLLVADKKNMNDQASVRLREKLAAYPDVEVKTLCLKQYNMEDQLPEVADLIAAAALIVTYKPIALFAETEFRDGTREILLADKPFYLYNQGLLSTKYLKWNEKLMHYVHHNDIAVLQVPSAWQEQVYRSYFTHRSWTDSSLRGCNITDIYYDPAYKEAVKEKFLKLFPEAEGKKVILYLPTVKVKNPDVPYASLLEIDTLKRLLGEEYVVAVQINAEQRKIEKINQLEIPGFSKILNKGITSRDLLIACDMVVGEYRDVFFEAAMVRKPTYSLGFDYENILKASNLSYNAKHFEDLMFCPVVRTTEELARMILAGGAYDYSRMDHFREVVMENCDGHSAERSAKYIAEQITENSEH